MKYILYSLYWINGSGYQPYEQVAVTGASLNGGIMSFNKRYSGILTGTDAQCKSAIDGCQLFSMQEITEDQFNIFNADGTLPLSYTEKIANLQQEILDLQSKSTDLLTALSDNSVLSSTQLNAINKKVEILK